MVFCENLCLLLFKFLLIPKAKGPYSVCRMSPLRETYLTGSGADEREEGKLNHCTSFENL